jgi:hypothetical protein
LSRIFDVADGGDSAAEKDIFFRMLVRILFYLGKTEGIVNKPK